jgi:trk system potassium uptake protein TrkA
MTTKILIVGGGRVGRHVAEQLHRQRNTVTMVEKDPEKCDRLSRMVSTVVAGSGTDAETWERVDAAELDVVAALTDDIDTNLRVCELAAEHAPGASTILRIAEDGQQDYGHRSFVDQIVYPAAIAADVTVEQISKL